MTSGYAFFQQVFVGNTLASYCYALLILICGVAFKKFIAVFITNVIFNRFVKRYASGVSVTKFSMLLRQPIDVFILLLSLYLAANQLAFPAAWELVDENEFGLRMIINRVFLVSIVVAFTWIVLRGVDFFALVLTHRENMKDAKGEIHIITFLKEAIKFVIATFSLFFMLGAIFKLDITSLIAGLGIGGLAIALAAKESVENLLGSFTIFLDKPFIVGDLVKTGNVTGHVERIGFRSTRIRTQEKTFLTVPNKKLVDSELDNLTERTLRKVNVTIGIDYQTPVAKIRAVVKEAQSYIESRSDVTGETKVRFYDFGKNALEILVHYYITHKDWETYVDVREEVNFKLLEIFEDHGVRYSILESVVTPGGKG